MPRWRGKPFRPQFCAALSASKALELFGVQHLLGIAHKIAFKIRPQPVDAMGEAHRLVQFA